MQVICLQDDAFYALIDQVVARIRDKQDLPARKWVTTEEAMSLLGIASKTTLQKFRDEGKIKFSQPERKIILYDIDSIQEFLEKHSKHTF